MPVPTVYRTGPEGALATYSYTDLAEATGVVVYYGGQHQEGTASSGFISTSPMYSNLIRSATNVSSNAYVKKFDDNYDVTFNMPKTIKGKIRSTITLGQNAGVDNNASETYAIIKAIHIDVAAAPTAIAQAQTETYAPGNKVIDTAYSATKNVEIDATSGTHFKKGETLRMTVEIWGKRIGTQSTIIGYGHDPKDRNDPGVLADGMKVIKDADTTQFIVNVPFKLDL